MGVCICLYCSVFVCVCVCLCVGVIYCDEEVWCVSVIIRCHYVSPRLKSCSLTEKSCAALASAARSTSCSLKQLDLSGNKIHDAGVQHLSDLLKNPHCKLEILT